MSLGHIGINVRELASSREYFDELMPLLGYEPFIADARQFSYRPVGEQPWPALFFILHLPTAITPACAAG